jgi:hypothetical protein
LDCRSWKTDKPRAALVPLSATAAPDWARLCALAEVHAQGAQLVFSVSAYNQGPDDVLQIDDASLQCIP